MYSATTNNRSKGRLNISDVGPGFGSTKLAAGSTKRAAGAPHIRAFCECVGVYAIRAALTLAVLSVLLLIAALPAQAQTETVLYNFTGGSDGSLPVGVIPDGAGNFYGSTLLGGSCPGWNDYGCGVVYELSPNGSGGWNQTVLHTFSAPPDGANADSPLLFDSKGNLYGDTMYGGAYNGGAVFEMSRVGGNWTESVLYSSGGLLASGIMMDPAGNIYGTTRYGPGGLGQGPVFELSPSGGGWTETVLAYTTDTSGCTPYAGLTMDAAGNIFGATCETVFELTPNGNGGWNLNVIHTFTGAPKDGDTAWGTPVFDKAGNLYGTTEYGGAKNNGTVYRLSPITKGKKKGQWKETILHSFRGGKDGATPYTGIVFDAAGNIYGTTVYGGASNDGTVYELVALVGKSGYKKKVLWSFNGTDGYEPVGLILDNAGNLYGTTARGGPSNAGVVFEVNPSAAVTTTALTSSPNPSTYGEAVTFTAVVSSSAGAPPDGETVSFIKGKTVLGTGSLNGGSASFTTSALPVGTNLVKAEYGGDSNFAGSTSNTVKQVVEKAKD